MDKVDFKEKNTDGWHPADEKHHLPYILRKNLGGMVVSYVAGGDFSYFDDKQLEWAKELGNR